MARELINGVPNVFGATAVNSGLPAKTEDPVEQCIVVDWSFDNLPMATAANFADAGNQQIPRGSFVVASRLEIVTAFAGGTSYVIGLVQADDGTTAISANGLMTATELVLAGMTPSGKWLLGAGALNGAVSSTTKAGLIKVAATGTFTAGRAKLYVTYIPSSVFS